jgi:uncharacterized protein YndB with AHSA1/START domain
VKDILDELTATERRVSRRTSDGTEEIAVLLRRTYAASVRDVWDAVTDPERMRRWFLPVSGDLRVGGAFQLEGNAGGDILRCEPPSSLTVTWGAPESLVHLRLSAEGEDATVLELEHTVPLAFAGSGAGALYVGPGWDISVLGLANFLRGKVVDDPAAWENTLEGQRFAAQTITAWVEAVAGGNTATAEEISAAEQVSRAQFTPGLLPDAGTSVPS